MTTHLIFISHAPTSATRSASFPADKPIDPPIINLSNLKSEILSMGTLTQAITGPEKRTQQTALALGIDLDFSINTHLRDWDYGRWMGRSLGQLQMEEPEAVGSWITDPSANPHGGESLLDVLKRTAAWMDERGLAGGRSLVVTHPAVIRAAILHAIQASPQSFWRINIDPLSLTDLRGHNGRWTLRSLSVTANGHSPTT